MKCEFCDSDTIQRKVRKQHWYKDNLYIIENVDAEVCCECGERYYHAKDLDGIDQLISGEHDIKKVLSVEVLTA